MRRAVLATAVALVLPVLTLVAGPPGSAASITGAPLPSGPDGTTAWQVSLGEADVYATWGASLGDASLLRTAADGSGSWEQVTVPSTGEPVTRVEGVDDGTVVQRTALVEPSRRGCTVRRVVTPTADWALPPCATGAVGNGGELVTVRTWATSTWEYAVYDADLGPVDGPLLTTHLPPALAGTWVWTARPGADPAIGGRDTDTGATAVLPVGDSCRQVVRVLEVVGDPETTGSGALVECGDRTVLVDLTRSSRAYDVTGRPGFLGNGFLYSGATGDLLTQDLSASATAHTVASFANRHQVWSQGRAFDRPWPSSYSGSTTGTPRVAFLDDERGVTVADLPPLAAPPTRVTDTHAPHITALGGSPAVVRVPIDDRYFTRLRFSWTASDDDAVAPTYDVQARSEDAGPRWYAAPGGSALLGASLQFDAPNPSRTCFRVRAVDRARNVSAWSAPRCTSIDAYRPSIADGRYDERRAGVVRARGAGVTYRFGAWDDVRVASYEVQQRTGRVGRQLSAWSTPPGARRLTATAFRSTVGAGQRRCFRARAHDVVGRVSAWGDPWCVSAVLS